MDRPSDERGSVVGEVVSSVLFLMAVTLLATLLIGRAMGLSAATVLSGSMTPRLQVGDLVVSREISPGELAVGQVVTFTHPSGETITHRVTDVEARGSTWLVGTKGDANRGGEDWAVREDSRVGLMVLAVPHAGAWLSELSVGPLRAVLTAGVSVLLLVVILGWIWREPRERSPRSRAVATR